MADKKVSMFGHRIVLPPGAGVLEPRVRGGLHARPADGLADPLIEVLLGTDQRQLAVPGGEGVERGDLGTFTTPNRRYCKGPRQIIVKPI